VIDRSRFYRPLPPDPGAPGYKSGPDNTLGPVPPGPSSPGINPLDKPGRSDYNDFMSKKRSPSTTKGYPAIAARTYASFRKALASSGCRLCPLAGGRTRIVVDRGEPGASILLVGEGPGAEEDRQGLAFVGRSGRLLDEMLLEAGLDPGRDVLIANVVKCRPPGNRAPRREEARRCLPYLRRQMELVKPRILVLLGATAVKHLLPGQPAGSLSSRAGRFLQPPEYPGIELLITFHPAYILRNRRQRPEMTRHLSLVAGRIPSTARERIP